ncbi:MAG TPA: hypothetical protein VN823_20600, partial [Stellaceae bacterium]|nr:hypothetical protein [Stellaceae bacterium]
VPSSAAIGGNVTPPELCAEPFEVPPVPAEPLWAVVACGGFCVCCWFEAPGVVCGVDVLEPAAAPSEPAAGGGCTGAGSAIGTAALSLLGSFLGAGGAGFPEPLSESLAVVGNSANEASELVAEARMSEKLGVAGALGVADGGKPPMSLGDAVMGAVFIEAPAANSS